MNICFSVNAAYLRYLYVCLTSLFKNNEGERICIYVFHFDLRDADLKCLKDLADTYGQELYCVRVERSLYANFHTEPYPTEAYLRLCMPYLLPETVTKMLYLDVDTIVEKPLKTFYETDLRGNYAVVCRDLRLVETWENGEKRMIRDESGKYFNSGVMLCDLSKIREDFRFEDYVAYASSRQFDLPFADQDILNALYAGRVIYAEADRYNYFVNAELKCGFNENVRDAAVILHFAGCCPWHHVKVPPSHKRWWYYAKQTPFYDELLEMKLTGTTLPKRLRV